MTQSPTLAPIPGPPAHPAPMPSPPTRTGPGGYSLPLSPSGRSSMLTPPPWHFAGEVVMVDYRVDPDAAARFLPPELELGPDPGAAAAIWAQWQWCSESADELTSPRRCQFGEFLILLACEHRGRPMARCPFAWVDHPVPMVRGWVQGMPKQLGAIHQTRPMRVGSAGPRLGAAGRFDGTVAVEGRQIAEASVVVTEEAVQPPALHTVPLVHTRTFPAWLPGEQPLAQLVSSTVTDVEFSEVWSGSASLRLDGDAIPDLGLLAPVAVGAGHVFGYAETLHGGSALS
ncbi:enduracididine biosynthesis enzyme MppR [Actinokineospora cianjurensis]|uniref:Enduracididine biosynthesis enzyme MppR n=1 Tax=Actinokineospora cianjurensis TaxID=585224 RepID=A0A421B0W0_9PSEU|nr:enduracididine biosynthesis enzyme MppR [Actinokineospora cianjurensis]RLK57997.1 enduracididine biosynthesis enzyme MppR [Actinokineospora cianjurensis]